MKVHHYELQDFMMSDQILNNYYYYYVGPSQKYLDILSLHLKKFYEHCTAS